MSNQSLSTGVDLDTTLDGVPETSEDLFDGFSSNNLDGIRVEAFRLQMLRDVNSQIKLSDLYDDSGVNLSPQTTTSTTTTTTPTSTTSRNEGEIKLAKDLLQLTALVEEVKGITIREKMSKENLSLLSNYVKEVAAANLPTLSSTREETEYVRWNDNVEELLSKVDLKSLTMLPKNVETRDETGYRDWHDNIKRSKQFKAFELMMKRGQEIVIDGIPDNLTLGCVYLAKLSVFDTLEENIYIKLKASLDEHTFKPVLSKKFFPGSLHKLYIGIRHQFIRHTLTGLQQRKTNFTKAETFQVDVSVHPETISQSILEESRAINLTYGGTDEVKYISEMDEFLALLNALSRHEEYALVIREYNKTGSTDYRRLLASAVDEYLEYIKQKPVLASPIENAHYAGDNKGYDPDISNVPHAVYDVESAMWVETKPGECYAYAIRGKCTRDNCPFTHVRGKHVDTSGDRSHNSGKQGLTPGNKFTPKAEPYWKKRDALRKGGNTNSSRYKAKVTRLIKALQSQIESSDEDVEPSLSDSGTDSSSEVDEEEFKSAKAMKANVKKFKKFFHKLKDKKSGPPSHPTKHPNKLTFDKKMEQIMKTQKKKEAETRNDIKAKFAGEIAKHILKDPRFQLTQSEEEISEEESK